MRPPFRPARLREKLLPAAAYVVKEALAVRGLLGPRGRDEVTGVCCRERGVSRRKSPFSDRRRYLLNVE
eukprot:217579-Lingulodinium_polyedra.AAC.1